MAAIPFKLNRGFADKLQTLDLGLRMKIISIIEQLAASGGTRPPPNSITEDYYYLRFTYSRGRRMEDEKTNVFLYFVISKREEELLMLRIDIRQLVAVVPDYPRSIVISPSEVDSNSAAVRSKNSAVEQEMQIANRKKRLGDIV